MPDRGQWEDDQAGNEDQHRRSHEDGIGADDLGERPGERLPYRHEDQRHHPVERVHTREPFWRNLALLKRLPDRIPRHDSQREEPVCRGDRQRR
jgi:hypothetical protein